LLILDSATILKALAKQYSFSLERETNE